MKTFSMTALNELVDSGEIVLLDSSMISSFIEIRWMKSFKREIIKLMAK